MRRWGIGVAVLALSVISGCGMSGNEIENRSAYAACQNFVLDSLRAPSTAEFVDYENTRVTRTAPSSDRDAVSFLVYGAVDAENGFGATIRTDFKCELRHGDGDNWQLVNLDL